jgi:hypothetical protein
MTANGVVINGLLAKHAAEHRGETKSRDEETLRLTDDSFGSEPGDSNHCPEVQNSQKVALPPAETETRINRSETTHTTTAHPCVPSSTAFCDTWHRFDRSEQSIRFSTVIADVIVVNELCVFAGGCPPCRGETKQSLAGDCAASTSDEPHFSLPHRYQQKNRTCLIKITHRSSSVGLSDLSDQHQVDLTCHLGTEAGISTTYIIRSLVLV